MRPSLDGPSKWWLVGVVIVIAVIVIDPGRSRPAPTESPLETARQAQQRTDDSMRAENILAATQVRDLRRLPDSTLRFLTHWQPSASAQKMGAVRDEVERRARQARINAVASASTNCGGAAESRITALMNSAFSWSVEDLARVACRTIWIGMSEEQLRASWGRPYRVNSSTSSYGTSDQWVYGEYGSSYVYLRNGIVTSWQQSR